MILTKKSALELLDLTIFTSQYEFVEPTTEESVEELFDKYLVYVDYAIHPRKDEHLAVQMKIIINPENNAESEKLWGYRLLVEGIALFSLKKEGLSEKELSNIVNFSAASIAISSIRGYISNLTAYAPFGRYMLPAIDMPSLIKEKARIWEEHQSKEKKSSKKKQSSKEIKE